MRRVLHYLIVVVHVQSLWLRKVDVLVVILGLAGAASRTSLSVWAPEGATAWHLAGVVTHKVWILSILLPLPWTCSRCVLRTVSLNQTVLEVLDLCRVEHLRAGCVDHLLVLHVHLLLCWSSCLVDGRRASSFLTLLLRHLLIYLFLPRSSSLICILYWHRSLPSLSRYSLSVRHRIFTLDFVWLEREVLSICLASLHSWRMVRNLNVIVTWMGCLSSLNFLPSDVSWLFVTRMLIFSCIGPHLRSLVLVNSPYSLIIHALLHPAVLALCFGRVLWRWLLYTSTLIWAALMVDKVVSEYRLLVLLLHLP